MSDNEQREADLRDKTKQPRPETHKTNPGPTPSNSQMNGSEEIIPADKKGLGLKDDSPQMLKKKDGPKPV
ncbi:hypothetical protein RBI13_18285 [Alcaligenaceae bacterium A4P071]|nr:hypothetical protein [Alcaligenaceae bacterium A4P071]